MGWLTDLLFEFPDRFLITIGATGGFVLGTAEYGLLQGAIAGSLFALLTYAIMQIEQPPYGPHQ